MQYTKDPDGAYPQPAPGSLPPFSFRPPSNPIDWRAVSGLDVSDVIEGNRVEALDQPVSGLSFSSDATTLATASFDGHIRIWDSRTSEPRHVLRMDDKDHKPVPQVAVKYSANGKYMLTAGLDSEMTLMSVAKKVRVVRFSGGHQSGGLAHHVSWFYGGGKSPYVLTGSEDGRPGIYSVQGGHTQNGIRNGVMSCRVDHCEGSGTVVPALAVHSHPKQRVIATGGNDMVVKLWRVNQA
ncbi:hypothetical protein KIPB_002840 [Kipferlia bialata]|uniref:Cleavage stimulation factor 50 kDa subunit n=1 Tax=Kipferlia bialata TaxID=797122 RepID=A0A9K3CSY3_9EUKA|nr:hypothetical protein KIPB_002840 [Kipferlia bialata]|eukprot:g2840.t1